MKNGEALQYKIELIRIEISYIIADLAFDEDLFILDLERANIVNKYNALRMYLDACILILNQDIMRNKHLVQ